MLIDALQIYKKPPKYRLILCKPNKEPISILKEAYGIIYNPNISSTNELYFSIPRIIDGKTNSNFKRVRGDYLILLELINEEDDKVLLEEYYIITNPNLISDDSDVKNVECKSLEHEINQKLIRNFNGVKKIYRTPEEISAYTVSEQYPTLEDFIESGILNYIISLIPGWSVGTVDEDINNKFRDIQVDERNALDYLINDVQNTFDCIFEFDTVNQLINVKKLTSLGNDKGLFISEKNYIKTIGQTLDFDEVVTKLILKGKDELSINSVNVTGTDFILDLSYYRNLDYMSQSLLDALDNYDSLLLTKEGEFQTLLSDLDSYTTQLATLNDELDVLESELLVLEDTKDAKIEAGEDLTQINTDIAAKETEISNKETEINNMQSNIDNTNSSIQTLYNEVKIDNNFTQQQIIELNRFIKEKTFRDVTYIDAQELKNDGKKIIERINQPPIEFNIDVVDFLDCVECQIDWDKLNIGDIVTIGYSDLDIDIQVRLVSYTHDYENNSLTLTFSNKTRLNDPIQYQADLIRNTITSSTSLDINKFKFGRYEDSGERNELLNYINSELNLATQKALAGSNQNIEIGRRGAIFKSTTDDLEQLRILNNLLVLTTDGFQTADIAISPAGIIARKLIGQILLGNQLYIEDETGQLSINGNKITIKDNLDNLRALLGEYADGKYGLLLKDSTGTKTILDEDGILQTWQEGRSDNVNNNYPLKLNVYLPSSTKSINKSMLRFRIENFRAYSTGAASGGGQTSGSSSQSTTDGGGNHRHLMMEYLGGVSPTNFNNEDAYAFATGDSSGGSGATFYIKSPGGYTELYTKGASGTHAHGMQHTHQINPHTHNIVYGIYEKTPSPTSITIKVNGQDITSALGGGSGFTSGQNELNISAYMLTGQWNTIELTPTTLCRLDATVFVQALMGVNEDN